MLHFLFSPFLLTLSDSKLELEMILVSNYLTQIKTFTNMTKNLSVYKTEVSQTTSMNPLGRNRTHKDLNHQCPLHKKPYPLQKCSSFREKPLEKHQTYLKENGIYFRCCASITHLAKSCKFRIKCTECNSDKHITTVHPGPASWTKGPKPASEYDREEDPTINITSQCTEICGSNLMERSYSKISLVKVYSKGQRDKAVKVYAIIDDQSNRSLTRSEFFNIFNDHSPSFA